MLFKILKLIHKGDYDYALVPDHPYATKNGYVLYHRVVIENHLGRLLFPEEVVHHKDHNKHNNSIENLELLSNKEHAKLHAKRGKEAIELKCAFCSKTFTREKRQIKKNYKNYFCSRSCNAKFYRYTKFKRTVA